MGMRIAPSEQVSNILLDPGPTVVLLSGTPWEHEVPWGQPWQVATPAYWIARTKESYSPEAKPDASRRHQLADSLESEVALCLLGGHGMPYEMGLAAFAAIQDAGVLDLDTPTFDDFLRVLTKPLSFSGASRKYRFASQRSSWLAGAIAALRQGEVPEQPTPLRAWLQTIRGIGPKTASWVVRNHFADSNVAILDVHIVRAAKRANVFANQWAQASQYTLMENAFLEWADLGNVRAADLDAVIWQEEAFRARLGANRARSVAASTGDR
jgi:N-glycosylase/DNA lyase